MKKILILGLFFLPICASAQSQALMNSGGVNEDSTSILSAGSDLYQPTLPAPAGCNSATASWGGACRGQLSTASSNSYVEAVNTVAGYMGAASYECRAGTYYATGDSTCDAIATPAPPVATVAYCKAFTMSGTYTNGKACSGAFPQEAVGVTDSLTCKVSQNLGNLNQNTVRVNKSTCEASGVQGPVTYTDSKG